MAQISTTAELEIKTLLVDWWTSVNTQLLAATGAAVQIGNAPVDLLFESEIGQRLVRIAGIAEAIELAEKNQANYPWSEDLASQVLEDCEAVEAWLNQGPIFHQTPDAFWTRPVGYMILRARVWANRDQLITLSAAAEISGMSLSVLSQRMTRGQMPGYRDPSIKNPRHARRVRRSDLYIMMHEHASHIPFGPSAYLVHTPASQSLSPANSRSK